MLERTCNDAANLPRLFTFQKQHRLPEILAEFMSSWIPKMPRSKLTTNHSEIHDTVKMRISSLVTLLALPLASYAAKKTSASTFDTYLAKQSSSAPVEIDEQGYNDLTSTPRDYSVAVLLTARPAKYACQICKDFDAEWSIIGRSWQKADRKGEHRVILTTVDFDQGRNVFMKVRCSLRAMCIARLMYTATTSDCPCTPPFPAYHRPQCFSILSALPIRVRWPPDC